MRWLCQILAGHFLEILKLYSQLAYFWSTGIQQISFGNILFGVCVLGGGGVHILEGELNKGN